MYIGTIKASVEFHNKVNDSKLKNEAFAVVAKIIAKKQWQNSDSRKRDG